MGGYGSGRHWSYTKSTVEDCCALDVNWMTREGMFDGGGRRSGSIRWPNAYTGKATSSLGYEVNAPEWWLRLHYRSVRDDDRFDYKVTLTTTELPWGGTRWWFTCPLAPDGQHCDRRVCKLYLPPGGRYFGCRHCYDLTYTSCQQSHKYDRIDRQLAAQVGMSFHELRENWGDPNREWRMENQAKRNDQRRRRRKAQGWV